MAVDRELQPKKTGAFHLQIGQPFNPFRLFNGIFIPEVLVRATDISLGAKITYGRLLRYAGQDGDCFPSVPTLASEIGTGMRQTQRYLAELERKQLIRRMPRFLESGQSSNGYVFLWHSIFEQTVKRMTPEGVADVAPEMVTDLSSKESQFQESQIEETNIDLDYPATNRIKRDSRLDHGDESSACKQYPRSREALTDYMTTVDDTERVQPSGRIVVDVMNAAAGASEDEVIQCLHYLRDQGGLKPGTKSGPRHFSWFKSVDRCRPQWSSRRSQPRSRSRFGLSRVPRATFQRLLCVALAPGVEQAMSRSGHALPLCKFQARTLFRQHHPATTDISAVA